MSSESRVRVWSEELVIPTYLPHAPDRNPMFLEKRVYQGSSGKVYPLPFTDRVAETKTERAWRAVWLENEYLRVLLLPEIGGRVHAIEDKTNGYDIIYRQTVIKPALAGLAGPWVSGGIEFNWPQHHRPATFLPVDHQVEEHADGSQTVWLGDHDPLARMKGMHGVRLHPGRAYVELKVRAYNRTPFVQTLHRADGGRLHRQPAGLQFSTTRRDEDVEPVLLPDSTHRPRAAREPRRGGKFASRVATSSHRSECHKRIPRCYRQARTEERNCRVGR